MSYKYNIKKWHIHTYKDMKSLTDRNTDIEKLKMDRWMYVQNYRK